MSLQPNKRTATVLCLDWHLSKSNAFKCVLDECLEPFATVDYRGIEQAYQMNEQSPDVVVLCQIPPAEGKVVPSGKRLVWLPMYDQARNYDLDWWKARPRGTRVLAFSRPIYDIACRAGLDAIYVQYFLKPDAFSAADLSGERVLLYWDRRGLLSCEALEAVCEALCVSRLIYRNNPDPGGGAENGFELPGLLGGARVEVIRGFLEYSEYQAMQQHSNIMIASRSFEGIGINNLEALAAGKLVLAYDAATMNEYIHDGEDGFLFGSEKSGVMSLIKSYARRAKKKKRRLRPAVSLTADAFDIKALAKADIQEIADAARRRHYEGRRIWLESIPDILSFVFD